MTRHSPLTTHHLPLLLLSLAILGTLARAEDQADYSGFYASPAIGGAFMDSRLPVRGGATCALRLGYDLNEPYSVEATMAWHPTRTEGDETLNAFRATLDWLYHFTRWEREDPFLSLGGGVLTAEQEVLGAGRVIGVVSLGGGMFYHLSEHFSLRGDAAFLATTHRGLCGMTASLGMAVAF